MKEFSERHGGGSPAKRLGLTDRLLEVGEILKTRYFPARIPLPGHWQDYYWGRMKTRTIANCRQHRLKYAA